MALRGSSFSYNNKLHRDSSSKVSSSAVPINSSDQGRRDQTVHGDPNPNPHQTLDQQPLYHHELNPNHNIHKPRRDPDQDTDPVAAPAANRSSLQQPPTTSETTAVADHHPTAATTVIISSSAAPLIRYRECLRNHAASMGGHVVDGCGEFMPSGEEGSGGALKCAACECHRSFHRKEINGESPYVPSCYHTHNPNKNNTRREAVHPQQPHQQRFSLGLSTCTPTMPIAPHVMMNFGGGGGGGGAAESSSEDLNMLHCNNAGGQVSSHPESSKKRFRTKFSQGQKEKMMEFAEKLGWRIQKQDEVQVQQFCAQVGVKRQVFKVWMHNNKQAMKKKQM